MRAVLLSGKSSASIVRVSMPTATLLSSSYRDLSANDTLVKSAADLMTGNSRHFARKSRRRRFVSVMRMAICLASVWKNAFNGSRINERNTKYAFIPIRARFWEMLGYLANTLIFILVGVVISQKALQSSEAYDWIMMLTLYVAVFVIRKTCDGGKEALIDKRTVILYMNIDALAFLPFEDIPAGMTYLRDNTPDGADELLSYFDRTYVTGSYRRVQPGHGQIGIRVKRIPPLYPPAVWNVNEATLASEPRTNNQCEGWNNRFTHLIGYSHPTIWILIEAIQKKDCFIRTQISEDLIGNPPTKRVRRKQKTLLACLLTLCEDHQSEDSYRASSWCCLQYPMERCFMNTESE
ncbi:hypothetical protein LSH36_147g09031 [Paralvinella palmiformis]|uniref:Uncharacterized protein n=1 Tax=Paralvinella palmiformis TaxID=53620 RepID=A0AAD9JW31_9ANNE|nr:hypothetical protein LSH36_147g09031 [Paralvinella palmiformis]